ncbi:MAG: protein-export chaperone SecB [Candidatus Parabeggiatoa sp.]|nr:protein-export chaperone SecB [Candidatus Parabeggiatoa sp.]
MMSEEHKKGYENHPIQLKALKVLELSIKVIHEPDQQTSPDGGKFSLFHGQSEYDQEKKAIAVKIGVEIGREVEESPFDLRVEILGLFNVDEDKFPIKSVHSWAKQNAPLILYPYLREQVFSLTSRAGFEGTLLPLFQVPTFSATKRA